MLNIMSSNRKLHHLNDYIFSLLNNCTFIKTCLLSALDYVENLPRELAVTIKLPTVLGYGYRKFISTFWPIRTETSALLWYDTTINKSASGIADSLQNDFCITPHIAYWWWVWNPTKTKAPWTMTWLWSTGAPKIKLKPSRSPSLNWKPAAYLQFVY